MNTQRYSKFLTWRLYSLIIFSLFAGALAPRSLGALAASGDTTRVSVASDGAEANYPSDYPSISADGRYVVFHSFASNLVSGDMNGATDVFVHNRQSGQTTLVSLASDGTQANSDSLYPSISADGRYVTFFTYASNLVSGDTNGATDVFVRDRQKGQTTRVSLATDGTQGNDNSYSPSISADGRYVVFHSIASNLVSGDTNGIMDVFVHDRQSRQTTRISVDSSGAQVNGNSWHPSLSADGRYATFYSDASNLVSGDTNGVTDIFVHDRQSGQTTRVSVDSSGAQANNSSWYTSISADGRYVAFGSGASNLVNGDTNGIWDIFVHDRQNGQTTRVSVDSSGAQANGLTWDMFLSADGRYVVFLSDASNLVSGDMNGATDVFVHDRQSGQTTLVSLTSDGTQANGNSGHPSLSADGRYMAFYSDASNLVGGDTNRMMDVFVHEMNFAGAPSQVYLPLISR